MFKSLPKRIKNAPGGPLRLSPGPALWAHVPHSVTGTPRSGTTRAPSSMLLPLGLCSSFSLLGTPSLPTPFPLKTGSAVPALGSWPHPSPSGHGEWPPRLLSEHRGSSARSGVAWSVHVGRPCWLTEGYFKAWAGLWFMFCFPRCEVPGVPGGQSATGVYYWPRQCAAGPSSLASGLQAWPEHV